MHNNQVSSWQRTRKTGMLQAELIISLTFGLLAYYGWDEWRRTDEDEEDDDYNK